MYYPYSENKGADQLRGHREADLRVCFRICIKPVFSQRGSFMAGSKGVVLGPQPLCTVLAWLMVQVEKEYHYAYEQYCSIS